ncbi:MAG: hypothetical protein M3Z27_01730 [Actinomycetota bacterium]|nr:hypothetical protein [Actinomycetota bacterium]
MRGIPVEAHWSIAIPILAYAGQLASTSYLGRYPELSSTTIMAMVIASVLLAPVSILLHELGHSFQARREGLRAEKITLWGLGGVAWIGAPRSPASSFRVVAAGPLVSALLAALLGGLGWLGGRVGLPEPVVGVTVLLAQFNAITLAFNLLPAFPMDGGRILHSLLWRLKGLAFAWAWATRAGIAVAAAVIATGVVVPFVAVLAAPAGGNLGFSIMFTGAVMLWMTLASRTAIQRSSSGPRIPVVGDLLELPAAGHQLPAHTTIAEFLETTTGSQGYGTCATRVVDHGRDLGVISPGLASQVAVDQRAQTTIAEVTLREADAAVLEYDTPVEEAFRRLQASSRRGIVLDRKQVTAIILLADLADVLLRIRDHERR